MPWSDGWVARTARRTGLASGEPCCRKEPTASSVAELDPALAGLVTASVDRGALPAAEAASTVLDLVAWERGEGDVRVLRDPAGRAGQALAVLADGP